MSDPLSSGVSNGDVDWVFRGKAKKLTKKMLNDMPSCIPQKEMEILQKRQLEESEKERDGSPDHNNINVTSHNNTSNINPPITNATNGMSPRSDYNETRHNESLASSTPIPIPTKSSLKSLCCGSNLDNHHHPVISPRNTPSYLLPSKSNSSMTSTSSSTASVASNNSLSAHVPLGTLPSSASSASATSKLFKLGRLRSSSNPVSPLSSQPPAAQETDCSSGSASGGGSGGAPSSPSTLHLSSSPNNAAPKRNSVSEGVKRSFFGSISSKFSRQSSVSSQELTSSVSTTPQASSIGPIAEGVVVDSRSKDPFKLNPNHLGDSSQSQDLSKLNKLPQGLGVGRRRSTLSQYESDSPSRKNSVNCSSSQHHQHQHQHQQRHHQRNHYHQKNDPLASVSLVRVCFAVDKLAYDPQQQIPSRKPRKGNVLIPEDIMAPPPRLSQGISVSASALEKKAEEVKYSSQEIATIIENHRRALMEAESHAHEAHLVARKVAAEVSQHKWSKNDINVPVEEDEIELNIKEIDKPLHVHEKHFEGEEIGPDIDGDDHDPITTKEATLDQIYTRCCHLREILPIPATLKQVKNKLKPLQVLKLLNPKPTLIDVLSFLDFIAITPINTIIFDNVTMTTEMLKHLLGSLVSSTYLEKLSLRNVPIDTQGWLILCKFLQKNKSLRKLDISQQRLKTSENCTLRSKMSWEIFFMALTYRGGMPELVLNGCKLSDFMFEQLLHTIRKVTLRLGIASTELNAHKFKLLIDWVTAPDSKCIGLDIGFNDLEPHVEYFNHRLSSHIDDTKLQFLSLNSTNLQYSPQTIELMKNLSQVKTIRFLDLSTNPGIFPKIIPYLSKYLPMFVDLRRIHFDLNELSPKLIAALANILPHIKTLVHVSFLGNRELTESAAAIIYTALKELRSIFALDLDYDLIPDELAQRIAFYLMKNMQYTMINHTYVSDIKHEEDDEELLYDGSIMMETAEKLLNEKGKTDNPKVMKILNDAIIERTLVIRKKIHNNIDILLAKKESQGLTASESDTLLKYCILDSSLDNVFTLFKEHATMTSSVPLSPSISIDEANNSSSPSTSASVLANVLAGNPSRATPVNGGPAITNRHPAIASIIGSNTLLRLDVDGKSLVSAPTVGADASSGVAVVPATSNTTAATTTDTTVPKEDLSHMKLQGDSTSSEDPPFLSQQQLRKSQELLALLPILYPRISDVTANPPQLSEPTVIPHDVVTTNVDGQEATIDNMTGRPVLMRSLSQTSEHDRELKEEEGELHKREFNINHQMFMDANEV